MKFIKWIAIVVVVAVSGYASWRYFDSASVNAEITADSIVFVHLEQDPYKGVAAQKAIAAMNKWLAANQNGWKTKCSDLTSEMEFYNPGIPSLSVKLSQNSVKLELNNRTYCRDLPNDQLGLVESLRAPLAEGKQLAEKEEKTAKEKEAKKEQDRIANLPACNFERNEKIAFENKAKKEDQLVVKVVGKPCYKATYSIEIKNPSGKSLYSYKADFKQHTAMQWDDDALAAEAARIVNETGSSKGWPTTGQLPKNPLSVREEVDQIVKVSNSKYSQLRKQNLPVFHHLTGYESWKYLVFDPDLGKAIVLIEGGE